MRSTILMLSVAATLLLGACGASDGTRADRPVINQGQAGTSPGADPFQDGGQALTPTTTPVDVVTRYVAARAAGDGATVCGLYTDRLAAEELSTTDEDEATTCAESIDLAGPNDFFAANHVQRITEIPDSVYGTEVVVLYSAKSEDHVVLEIVNGEWRIRNILDS